MAQTHRLKRDASFGTLLEGDPFKRRLGMPIDGDTSKLTLLDLETPRLRPGSIEEPVRLEYEGKLDVSLIERWRPLVGGGSAVDLIVSAPLEALLRTGSLPRHATMACEAFLYPSGSMGFLPKNRSPKGPTMLRWLWWEESFEAKLDPRRSVFLLRRRDGTSERASYDSLEDLEQVSRRASSTLEFDLKLEHLAWTDAAVDQLDVVTLGVADIFVSERMAKVLRDAALPGVKVVPLHSFF